QEDRHRRRRRRPRCGGGGERHGEPGAQQSTEMHGGSSAARKPLTRDGASLTFVQPGKTGGAMSLRAGRVIATAAVAVFCWSSGLRGAEVVTHPYPGITLIKRKEIIPLPAPNANPLRQVKMNIVLVDLDAP